MSNETNVKSFHVARMSLLIRALTVLLLALPPVLVVYALLGKRMLAWPAAFLIGLYALVWLWFRPIRFVVHRGGIRVVWPLRHCEIPREDIASARVVDRRELQSEIGFALRIGVGGLWGGFGWLWTTRRGLVRMYITRTDRFVWIERVGGRLWLITPENPDEFVRALLSVLNSAP
ncbi:MAG TPA: PH domain-containing protein [Verrucomicrobiota bacterium]|nr:PH domain-containing protein [Verrucomicrobiota bacterium]